MGSGASGLYEIPGGDLRLPASGLRFSINQLRVLNTYVDALHKEDQKGRMSAETESAVESLVQRIVDGAGQRDPRFRCCHLIALHRGKKMRSRSLEYLVTLDSLPVLNSSEDCRLQDGPPGYGKIRLTGRHADKWEEFLTPSGYLCRDKVIEKWVELIARCAHARGGGGSRVLCARAALRASPHHYCYLERATAPQVSQERRLAIVEGAAWVMVRVGAGEAEAKLMLGVKVDGCNAAAYTTKLPLTHPLALLHYTSAKGGYYAAAVGPPSSIVCAERAATWQLWQPALEASLDAHCSDLSPVARITSALNALVDRMREGGYKGSLKVLSRYAVSCALRRRMDRCAGYAMPAARCVVSSHVAHHLLLVLDSLLSLCERGGVAGYVFPVERGSVVRRGARDSDWAGDAACVRSCLAELHQIAGEDIPPTPGESLELALFNRWENLNKEWKSSCGPAPSYSRRQLRYLWRVAAELIACKNMVVVESHSTFHANLIQATSVQQEAVEDLIHILAIMLDQARDQYLLNLHSSCGEFDRELSAYRSKKWHKLKDYYDASSACLIDAVRRDPDLRSEDLSDPLTVIKQVLNWLHKGAKDDKKYLGPVLKPYLDGLFAASLENSWFLDDFDSRKCEKEFEGLKEFCIGVHDGTTEPCMGLLDAAKRLSWAKTVVDFVDRFKHVGEYFDEDDEPPTPALAYIPAPGSPTNEASCSKREEEDEEDPLDAYMAGLERQAAKDLVTSKENAAKGADCSRGARGDIDDMDDEESYYKYMEDNPLTAGDDGSDQEIEYDQDGNPLAPPKKKFIDPLPPIDHSEIEYEPFEKNFYTPHEDIDALTHQQVEELKKKLGVKITGPDPPKPVSSFGHMGFDEQLIAAIRRSEYSQPTPIQAAAVPAALSGRDLIGIARTGSGKTAAFLWPLLVHIMDQRELGPGDGPIGLVLAPTRELAQQIYMEAKRFGKVYNIRCVCCYGGGSKWEQTKALEGGGAEIIVGTPGRVIDLIKCKATSLQRVTYLVLDEADRMFDMGFEPQVRSICNHVRPERQALLFSAKFPRRVERLARDALHDPVRVTHGAAGEASGLVTQHVKIFNRPEDKWKWLLQNLVEFLSAGSILIFVTKKLEAEQTAANLGVQEYDALLLHGDMEQADRNKVITAFKRQQTNILVATDVAARGLDIPHIRTVINYTIARDIDTHTHRVGRTGRAGVRGDAWTLLHRDKDKEFAGHLVRNIEGAMQEVPEELMSLALQSAWFRKSRFKKGKGKNLNIGGCGLGYKERPGLPTYNDDATSAAIEKITHGPATDRLSSLKQAFRSQYNQFTASSDHSWEQTMSSIQPGVNAPAAPSPPPPPPPPAPRDDRERVRKSGKKSRWE